MWHISRGMTNSGLPPYSNSLAGVLLAAREAVMAPIRPVLRDANVTEQQWRVLRVLEDAGALEPTPLSRMALLHAPSVTRILRELQVRGLITRTADRSDARRSIVTITPAGAELVVRTASHTRELLLEFETRFGAERLAALRGELAALTAAIEGLRPQVAHPPVKQKP